ncbi:hypothetical protein [Psychroserpens sp. NJDZ02]|uniref:hypothetical protein n=1 Tax=Psychroserpens sp. NJDZ02 TaxID=2570561 RepID=UPI0010A8FE00|nr:hypothetical protein [Psychroserpens sp. NJDZ02]QCE43037.1 hypothetical protein E9099_16970 [Psychroserpens sp. NJDZ02]
MLLYSLSNINPDLAIAKACFNKQTFRNYAYNYGNDLKGSSLILYLIEKDKFMKNGLFDNKTMTKTVIIFG